MNITLNKNNLLNIVFLTLFLYFIIVLINKKNINSNVNNNINNIEGFSDNNTNNADNCYDKYKYWSKLSDQNTIKEYEKKYHNCFTDKKKKNFRNTIKQSIEILNNFDISNEDLCEQVKIQLNNLIPNPNAHKLVLDSFKCKNTNDTNNIENFQEKENLTDEDLLNANNISNFNINEYKRWLLLHKSTMDKLSSEHLNNLKKLINNKNLQMKDLPKKMEIEDPKIYKKKSLDDMVSFKKRNAKLDNEKNINKFYNNIDGLDIQSNYINNFSKYPKFDKIKLYMKDNKHKKDPYKLDEYLAQQDKNRHKNLNKKLKQKN